MNVLWCWQYFSASKHFISRHHKLWHLRLYYFCELFYYSAIFNTILLGIYTCKSQWSSLHNFCTRLPNFKIRSTHASTTMLSRIKLTCSRGIYSHAYQTAANNDDFLGRWFVFHNFCRHIRHDCTHWPSNDMEPWEQITWRLCRTLKKRGRKTLLLLAVAW